MAEPPYTSLNSIVTKGSDPSPGHRHSHSHRRLGSRSHDVSPGDRDVTPDRDRQDRFRKSIGQLTDQVQFLEGQVRRLSRALSFSSASSLSAAESTDEDASPGVAQSLSQRRPSVAYSEQDVHSFPVTAGLYWGATLLSKTSFTNNLRLVRKRTDTHGNLVRHKYYVNHFTIRKTLSKLSPAIAKVSYTMDPAKFTVACYPSHGKRSRTPAHVLNFPNNLGTWGWTFGDSDDPDSSWDFSWRRIGVEEMARLSDEKNVRNIRDGGWKLVKTGAAPPAAGGDDRPSTVSTTLAVVYPPNDPHCFRILQFLVENEEVVDAATSSYSGYFHTLAHKNNGTKEDEHGGKEGATISGDWTLLAVTTAICITKWEMYLFNLLHPSQNPAPESPRDYRLPF